MRTTALLVAAATVSLLTVSSTVADETALAIFKQRITPILNAPNPSSCAECHLSGVDLKQYIGENQEQTFASLRAAGLINLQQPAESKLLKFIQRHSDRETPVSRKVREQEYTAFRAWIEAAVKDPQLAAAGTADPKLGPQLPVEVLRHARRDRVLQSFIANVWSEVNRCAACHSSDRNQKQVANWGDQMSWITPQEPQKTLEYLLETEIIDVERPAESLLVAKPTLQVQHEGGKKISVGDRTYRQFMKFLLDYAATAAGKYSSAAQLPRPSNEVTHLSNIFLKLVDVPETFGSVILQVDLYRWNAQQRQWSPHRWATADNVVQGKKRLWQQNLTLTAPRDSDRAKLAAQLERLPAGVYLGKIYADRHGKLAKDIHYELGKAEFVGQFEVDSRWSSGYRNPTVVAFPTR